MSPTVDLCLYVNGERVPEALVLDELKRLRLMPYFQQIPDLSAREAQLIFAAESGAVDRVLLKQEAAKDTTPISIEEMEREYAVLNSSGGCRPGMDPNTLIPRLENQARFSRAVRTLVGTPPQLESFIAKAYYDAHAEEFRAPETFNVSHIVKNISEGENEESAREAIEAALACVRRGEDFSAVARRFSDCPHDGGRLPAFPRGAMVKEFEEAILKLETGQASEVFRTPFGFHVAILHGRNTPRALDFEEAREGIEKLLLQQLEQQSLRQALDRLRMSAAISREAFRQ